MKLTFLFVLTIFIAKQNCRICDYGGQNVEPVEWGMCECFSCPHDVNRMTGNLKTKCQNELQKWNEENEELSFDQDLNLCS